MGLRQAEASRWAQRLCIIALSAQDVPQALRSFLRARGRHVQQSSGEEDRLLEVLRDALREDIYLAERKLERLQIGEAPMLRRLEMAQVVEMLENRRRRLEVRSA
jgi:hypothetical protein